MLFCYPFLLQAIMRNNLLNPDVARQLAISTKGAHVKQTFRFVKDFAMRTEIAKVMWIWLTTGATLQRLHNALQKTAVCRIIQKTLAPLTRISNVVPPTPTTDVSLSIHQVCSYVKRIKQVLQLFVKTTFLKITQWTIILLSLWHFHTIFVP